MVSAIRPGGLATPPTAAEEPRSAPEPQPHGHLYDSPFQTAPPGHAFEVRARELPRYDRPGLAGRSPLEVQISRLTGTTSRTQPTKLLDSVRSHPARTNPINAELPSIEAMWPRLTRAQLVRQQASVTTLLQGLYVQRTDGTGRMSLDDKLMDPALPLNAKQRNRIKQCFAEYRHSLDKLRPFDTKASDENWNHICHEAAQVIDAATVQGLSGEKMEDALLASMFSDAVKFRSTLLTHNIHGAIAADIVLTRRKDPDMPPERVAGIVQATKEHQIGVPGLFAKLATMFIGFGVGCFPGMDRKDHFTADEVAALDRIETKLASPLSADHTALDETTGARAIVFDEVESGLLKKIGVHEWPVPEPSSPWFDATMTVIYADSVQYGMPDGVGKIQLMSGPGTDFADATTLHSAFSCGISYLDCGPLIRADLTGLYDAAAARTNRVLERVVAEVDAELAAGGVVFDPAQLRAVVDNYGVDMTALKTVKTEGAVRVLSPAKDRSDVPFFHSALDYNAGDSSIEYAKLIRSRVANAMRNAAEWFRE